MYQIHCRSAEGYMGKVLVFPVLWNRTWNPELSFS